MAALERGLTVGDIATWGAFRCGSNARVADVQRRPELADIDTLAVESADGVVVGALRDLHQRPGDRFVEQCTDPLDERVLVQGERPLTDHVQTVDRRPFQLVRGADGIVTHRDLNKLPVYLLIYALCTHPEATLLRVIRQGGEDENSSHSISAAGSARPWRADTTIHVTPT